MKGFHPKLSRAVQCAIVVAVFAGGGCRSSSSGVNNPFLAPDRVSPPSTRLIAPGQAQPYYQGDPLPVMQSGVTPPTNSLVASNSSVPATSSGNTLAWNNPGGAPSVDTPLLPSTANSAAPWGINPPPAKPSYGSEPAVAVPVDQGSLRFALPEPTSPEPITPIAVTPPAAPQAVQPAVVSPDQPVMLASFTAPVATAPASNPVASLPAATSPWRTPQLSPTVSMPTYGLQPSPQPAMIAQAPAAVYANPVNVPVQLRAVPSPQPSDPNPRIRIPGYATQQAGNADGFRPRTSMQ